MISRSRASVLITAMMLSASIVAADQPPAREDTELPDMAFLEYLGGMLEEDGELIDPLALLEPATAEPVTQPDAQQAPQEEN